jgi:hypothetical protein
MKSKSTILVGLPLSWGHSGTRRVRTSFRLSNKRKSKKGVNKDAATGRLPNELLCGGNRLAREASLGELSAHSLS